jgi:hypothetical protein
MFEPAAWAAPASTKSAMPSAAARKGGFTEMRKVIM